MGRYLSWMTTPRDPLYAGYRYPPELISYAVWLYFRFPLSVRIVEEMLAARGISVTYETIRQWGLKFGREFANCKWRDHRRDANFLVNRRMNKLQQMRWSRRGGDLLLQVRCAVYNGTLGSDFGQKFQPANDPSPLMAIAA